MLIIIKMKSIHFLSYENVAYTHKHARYITTNVTGRGDRKESICDRECVDSQAKPVIAIFHVRNLHKKNFYSPSILFRFRKERHLR